jgi:hypothetical protein
VPGAGQGTSTRRQNCEQVAEQKLAPCKPPQHEEFWTQIEPAGQSLLDEHTMLVQMPGFAATQARPPSVVATHSQSLWPGQGKSSRPLQVSPDESQIDAFLTQVVPVSVVPVGQPHVVPWHPPPVGHVTQTPPQFVVPLGQPH